MKKILFMLVAAIFAFTVVSCSKDETSTKSTCTATTLDVTDVSSTSFTFNAEFEYDGLTFASGDVYFSDKPGVSKEQYLFCLGSIDLKKGKNSFSKTYTNKGIINITSFPSGTTIYYKAYAYVHQHEGEPTKVYGEEKSFIIP